LRNPLKFDIFVCRVANNQDLRFLAQLASTGISFGLAHSKFFPFHYEDLIFELDDQVLFVSSYILSDTPLVFNSTNTTPINIRQSNDLDFRDNDAHIKGSGSGRLSIFGRAKQRLSVPGSVTL